MAKTDNSSSDKNSGKNSDKASSAASSSKSSNSDKASAASSNTRGASDTASSKSSNASKASSSGTASSLSSRSPDKSANSPRSIASESSRSPVSRSIDKSPTSLSGSGGGKNTSRAADPKADKAFSSGPSFDQFRDFVDNPGPAPRVSPAFDGGPSFDQFRDFVGDPGPAPRVSPAFDGGPSFDQLRDFLDDGRARNRPRETDPATEPGFTPANFNPLGGIADWWGEQVATHDANVAKRDAAGEPVFRPDPVGGLTSWAAEQQAVHDANVSKRREAGDFVFTPSPPDLGGWLTEQSKIADANLARRKEEAKGAELMSGIGPGYNALTPEQRAAMARMDAAPAVRDIAPSVWAPSAKGGALTDPAAAPGGIIDNKTAERLGADPQYADAMQRGIVADMPDAARTMPDLPRARQGYAPAQVTAEIQLPRSRPDMIATNDGRMAIAPPPGMEPMGGIDVMPVSDEAAYAEKYGRPDVAPPKNAGSNTIWDNVVNGAGSVLEHTTLGGIVKAIAPDLWNGAGDAMKNFGSSPLDYSFDYASMPNNGSLVGIEGGGGEGGAAAAPAATAPIVPPGSVPTDTATLASLYDRYGDVVFPQIPPYNPGIDNEWLYFRNRNRQAALADGGIVQGYADGGEVSPMANADPRIAIIADAEDALQGELPDPEPAIALFVKTFGEAALEKLKANVTGGMRMRGKPRLVEGPGGPREDAIPTKIDNTHEASLSDGEFVMPADAVMAAGDGDRAAGADKLTQLSDMLRGQPAAGAVNVEKVA